MTALFAAVLLAWPYMGPTIAVPLGGRTLDAPLADVAGAALLAVVALPWLRARTPLPGAAGVALLLLAGLLALPNALDPAASLHFLVRKPLFLWLAYGGALAWVAARRLPPGELRRLLLLATGVAAAVSFGTSVARLLGDDPLGVAAIPGLTNNHKTVAVALAPAVPLLLGLRRGRVDDAVLAAVLGALALSLSRTAWIAAAVGASFYVAWRGRALAARPAVAAGAVALMAAVAVAGPVLAGAPVQVDAADSRRSLDWRAWSMFQAHPAVGMGGGTNVLWREVRAPDERVNGVDAHGLVQKVGSELGLLGLVGWATFAGAVALRLRARAAGDAEPGRAAWASFVALHAGLLASTETFSHTAWVPLGLCWGLSLREGPP